MYDLFLLLFRIRGRFRSLALEPAKMKGSERASASHVAYLAFFAILRAGLHRRLGLQVSNGLQRGSRHLEFWTTSAVAGH